ncbi:hypothetical protein K504DRAFT_21992 [Pleomassaria siparia CBS 279.74]|uniref:Subtelomeric hrmA-associated cluster protein AFUB-079030/YDR124W-like helical bundle domain-containing protein n=1 Tax=Pleomassaria siparia CBS 279.74 TaxID=1314801 RepID=A0A6G1KS35_9PLEO|nr:hypothetical protein K504DRAFT_21992 [Pleomassaria siparia CBS 279.74]
MDRTCLDDVSSTEESNSVPNFNHVKRRMVHRKQSMAKSRSEKRKRDRSRPNVGSAADHESTIAVTTVTTYQFYVGDFDKVKFFFRTRLEELNQKVVKPIVTKWLRHLEPSRLGQYGPYSNEPNSGPPWWPKDVPYKEPSHLKAECSIPLGIAIMLIHRKSDDRADKRSGHWMSELKERAMSTLNESRANELTSSTDRTFVEEAKKRAYKIVENLFEHAQSYEDHLAQYDLYEGSGAKDPGNGKHITWSAIPKPVRSSNKRRAVQSSGRTVPEISGDDTEMDETPISPSHKLLVRPAALAIPHSSATPESTTTTESDQTFNPPTPQQPYPIRSPISPLSPSPHPPFRRYTIPKTSFQAATLSHNELLTRYIPASEVRRNSEPHENCCHELQRSYSESSCAPFALQGLQQELCALPHQSQAQTQYIPISGPELHGYVMPNGFHTMPTIMSTATRMYTTQPEYPSPYVQGTSYSTYPSVLPQHVPQYSPYAPPETPMDTKMTIGSCNTSFGSMTTDMDMDTPVIHGLPYASSMQYPSPNLAYCGCRGDFCTCGAAQTTHSRP